jgi:BMFP domain-containing protein YqiC
MSGSFLNDWMKLISGGAAIAHSVKEEMETSFKSLLEKFSREAGFASAEDLDIQKQTVNALLERVKLLEARLEKLENPDQKKS